MEMIGPRAVVLGILFAVCALVDAQTYDERCALITGSDPEALVKYNSQFGKTVPLTAEDIAWYKKHWAAKNRKFFFNVNAPDFPNMDNFKSTGCGTAGEGYEFCETELKTGELYVPKVTSYPTISYSESEARE